jgi:hypothetical protein
MRIKCIGNRGTDLPQWLIDIHYAFPSSEFNLTTGEIYTVYAISLWRNTIGYLILTDESTSPTWEFPELFQIVDPRLPKCWHFGYFGHDGVGDQKSLMALWGYQELVEDKQHYVDLIEGESQAIEIFYKRKLEIDESS